MKFTTGPSNGKQPFSAGASFKVSTSYGASFARPARDAAADSRTLQAVLQVVQGGDLHRAIVMAERARIKKMRSDAEAIIETFQRRPVS